MQHQPTPTPPTKTGPNKKVVIGAVVAGLIVLGAIGSALDNNDTTSNATDTTTPALASPSPNTATAPAAPAQDTDDAPAAAELPNLVGKGLQAAQDQAQEAGFYQLTSHDATGRGRMQISDRGWKVCFQAPAPGEHPTDTEIDLGVVKLDEDCPADDKGIIEPADDGTMPDLVGDSVRIAHQTLPSNASITTTDASGQDRIVINGANWTVCTQTPAAGTAFDGEPVELTAVKVGETCP
ncbi:hypothetical protein F0L17_14230 [Streptomyces sp. TRM43335]|uniref:PASTA domain-containing protein n=1 Tax=Streptomyces taklimakanensis TaxID=2569853 RepID=A0A6G2BD82_9ACTN|nr:hypothetical protein [Streptomyces taklimakanensis]MTE20245.1 hypothetical protein [Streptomyces taklimakanensis]